MTTLTAMTTTDPDQFGDPVGDFDAPETPAKLNIDLGDIDRTERFIEFLESEARYVPQHKHWFLWNGDQWKQDENDASIVQKAIAFMKERVAETNSITEPKERQKAWIAAKLASTQSCMSAMIKLAGSYPNVCTHLTEFDSDPWLLGVQNGVVDLKTGQFRATTARDLIWKRSKANFDAAATCPRWIKFLDLVLPDPEVREFIQRAVGYSLTAMTGEQVLFFLYGSGQNGKTTFINMLESLMGAYQWRTNAKLFLDDKYQGDAANLMATLPEKRVVIGAEVGDSPLNETRVKDLTGGDTLNARKLYCEAFTFKPTHKLWFYGNDRPTVNSSDDGIWRRMVMIPFEIKIPEEMRDRNIDANLWSEASGVLNWAIEGCLKWQKDGLRKPHAVITATAAYRESEDSIGEFMEERCEFGPTFFAPAGELYNDYSQWCEARGVPKSRIKGEKKVAAWLRHKQCKAGKQYIAKIQYRGWTGVKIADPSVFGRKGL